MKLDLPKTVEEFLSNNVGSTYTAREIAEWIWEHKKQECLAKIKRTTLNNKSDLLNQVVAEIGRHNPTWHKRNIHITADSPHKYYYDNQLIEIIKQEKQNINRHNEKREHELYPKLAAFCQFVGIDTLRIDEKKSLKDKGINYNKWLHADVVGFKDLTQNYTEQTRECIREYSTERSVLYSFEVKEGSIKNYNLREFFFQTVSNSSWANYSYLVAEDVDKDAIEELQLLCSSFNIGFIKLNKEKPEDSSVRIQAIKTELDWNMMNRISVVNPDFRKYLENITLSYKGHNKYTAKPEWDIKNKSCN